MAKGGEGSYTGFGDMFDGGGAGAVGDTFQGGPFSGLLNSLGVKPHGYWDRQEGMGQVRPPVMSTRSAPMPTGYPQQASGGLPPQNPGPSQGPVMPGMGEGPMMQPGMEISPDYISNLMLVANNPNSGEDEKIWAMQKLKFLTEQGLQ